LAKGAQGRGANFGMIGQTEIIIRGEVQETAAADSDVGGLGGIDLAKLAA
jgi:hypothetical protein